MEVGLDVLHLHFTFSTAFILSLKSLHRENIKANAGFRIECRVCRRTMSLVETNEDQDTKQTVLSIETTVVYSINDAKQ